MAYSKYQKPIDAEFKRVNLRAFHLAGIVPVDIAVSRFGTLWHDALMPIAPDYTAIEHAVFVAAWAGCETIWVVCPADQIQIVKKLVGEWVNDPVEIINDRPLKTVKHLRGKKIPIFYVSPTPRDKVRYRGLAWSILWGAKVAQYVSKKMSWWLEPDTYFVSFPQSIFSYNVLREHRTNDISSKHRFYVSYKGRTVKNGLYLPFTFRSYDLKRFITIFSMQARSKVEIKVDEDGFEANEIPFSEQYSGKYLSLLDIFFNAIIGVKSKLVETSFYYPISDWESWCNYCGSEERRFFHRPKGYLWSKGHVRKVRDLTKEEEKIEET